MVPQKMKAFGSLGDIKVRGRVVTAEAIHLLFSRKTESLSDDENPHE